MGLLATVNKMRDLVEAMDVAKMAPDTRTTHLSRKAQIDAIAGMLEAGKKPFKDDDPETQVGHEEVLFDMVYGCTHNDVVARAVAAAEKIGGWVKKAVLSAAKEREKLNQTRAANEKKYGKKG